ncbi:MAG TPA: carbohydrate kinase family protein [Abditibacteriaceae bacterium]|nr:carbohydrate kinase family protein [Abditibacteriaceae bacterium]
MAGDAPVESSVQPFPDRKFDVVCLGILVADVGARPVGQYRVASEPPGEDIVVLGARRGGLAHCDQMQLSIGGCAANTGIGLQKLGVRTAVIGKVGHDLLGHYVRGEMKLQHVHTRGVVSDPDVATSATMVMIAEDGERSFIHYPGANATFNVDDIDWDLIQEAGLLHVAGHFLMPRFDGAPCAAVLQRARQMGLKTALDTAGDQSKMTMELLRPALPHVDYFVPSYAEARRCVASYGTSRDTPEEVARVFLDEGVGVVALKMGESGSYIKTRDAAWRVPAFQVEVVDATGAGDAFAAGFLAGVVRGFDLTATGQLASAVGACCVTAIGTVRGVRSLDETLAFIQEQAVKTGN